MTKRSTRRKREPAAPTLPPTWDERLIQLMQPWGREIGGVALFIVAALTLFGLSGLSQTAAMTLWTNLIWITLGWVSYLMALFGIALGLYIATRRMPRSLSVSPSQIIGIGLFVLALAPLTHLLSNTDPAMAQIGRGGGRLGWALSEPLVLFFGTGVAYFFHVAMASYGAALAAEYTGKDLQHHLRILTYRLQLWSSQLQSTQLGAGRSGRNIPRPPKPRPVIDRKKMEDLRKQLPLQPTTRAAQAASRKKPTPNTNRRNPHLPAYELLEKSTSKKMSPSELAEKRRLIKETLDDFGIPAEVLEDALVGPAVTQFAVVPGYDERKMPDGTIQRSKVRVNKIAGLTRDMALALAAPRIRIQAPVPGQGIVGIEVPNSDTSVVHMGNVVDSDAFRSIKGSMGIAMGQDVAGEAVATDTTKLPHMLVAGQTGSGKSVFMNALIACLVFNNSPEDLQMVMIDPKKVELVRFNGLPHVIGKVEVEGERAIGVLRWLTAEMDDRYEKLSAVGARNISSYNQKIKKHRNTKKMPYIVAFIDELADLMAQFGGDVERALCRLAQMARATGIHLVVATQRPSTDVITGLIKANFPARVSFAVASGTDSRVILDSTGAESLLGKGDMLFLGADASSPQRIQGCFVSDDEIDEIVKHWQDKYKDQPPNKAPWETLIEKQAFIEDKDEYVERAMELAQKYDTLSTSMLQRRLRIGYPRAARIMQTLHEMGLVEDPQQGGSTRRSLVDKQSDDPLADFLAKHGEEYIDYPDKPDFDNL